MTWFLNESDDLELTMESGSEFHSLMVLGK